MKPRLLSFAVAIVTAAAIGLLGYGLLLGLAIGFALGLLVGFVLTRAQPRSTTQSGQLPAFDPALAQKELEAAYLSAKRVLREEDGEVDTQIYRKWRETLHYLPASPVKGAVEIWSTIQRQLLHATLSDLRSTEDRALAHKRIMERCASFPLALRALASTLLPDETLALDSQEGSAFYLENLHSLPAFQTVEQGKAIEKLREGHYFCVGGEIFVAKERFLYRCGSDCWHEVLGESLRDGSIKALEWETEDHQLEILLQTEGPLSLHELNLQLADLKKMDDREEGSVTFRGDLFRYDESDKATCQASTSSEVENFTYYDFINPATKEVLGIERWGSETKAYLMRPVALKDVEIFSV